MSKWIDFKELRAKLDFEKVLRHYGVEVKRKLWTLRVARTSMLTYERFTENTGVPTIRLNS